MDKQYKRMQELAGIESYDPEIILHATYVNFTPEEIEKYPNNNDIKNGWYWKDEFKNGAVAEPFKGANGYHNNTPQGPAILVSSGTFAISNNDWHKPEGYNYGGEEIYQNIVAIKFKKKVSEVYLDGGEMWDANYDGIKDWDKATEIDNKLYDQGKNMTLQDLLPAGLEIDHSKNRDQLYGCYVLDIKSSEILGIETELR